MRIAICEDEPYMVEDLRGRLQRYASECGCFLQVSEFQEGEALLCKRGNQSQVIFIAAY